jgi:N-acetylglutamate synthase-like GNAT family acetyltransferase
MKEVQIIFPQNTDETYIDEAVSLVNQYSKEGLMLPVSFEKYQTLSAQKKLLIAVSPSLDVVGTVAYTFEYPKDIWELGGLAVKEGWLHKGIATVLVQQLLKQNPHGKTIAVANKNSHPLLAKMGAKKINFPNSLPSEIYEPCIQCPVRPESGCCDTLLSLAPIVLNLAAEGMSIRQIDRLLFGIGENQLKQFEGVESVAEQW